MTTPTPTAPSPATPTPSQPLEVKPLPLTTPAPHGANLAGAPALPGRPVTVRLEDALMQAAAELKVYRQNILPILENAAELADTIAAQAKSLGNFQIQGEAEILAQEVRRVSQI